MKISIILAHPNPESFNHAIAATAAAALRHNGHHVALRDLYKENFEAALPASELTRQPKLDAALEQHCKEIATADGIIVVHPNWWSSPPAILKGWVDRVLRPGVAYRFVAGPNGEGHPEGLLAAKSALVFNTANTPQEREEALLGDPLEVFWKKCVFALCGVKNIHRRNFSVVITSTPQQRKTWLDEVTATVNAHYPTPAGRSAHNFATTTAVP